MKIKPKNARNPAARSLKSTPLLECSEDFAMLPVSTVSFAGLVLDRRRECVLRDGTPVKLRRKCFQALSLLAEHSGGIVSREHLTAHLWPDTTVGEDSLHQCIGELRKSLGDAAQQV